MRAACVLMALAMFSADAGAQATTDLARIADILSLPRTADAGRRAGVPSSVMERVLDSLRRREVSAADAEEILRREINDFDRDGDRDNFGAFVNSQLALGLRGRELADAIHREQDRRGIGRGRGPARVEDDDARRKAEGPPRGGTPDEKAVGKNVVPGKDREKSAEDSAKGRGKGRRP